MATPKNDHQALDDVIALAATADAIVKKVDRAISSYHGLSLSDLRLLLELQRSPDGRVRRVELAERLGVTPSGIARQLGPLERIGLVDRERHATDARLALVVLTATGDEMATNATATAQEAAEHALSTTWTAADQVKLRQLTR